MPPRRGAQQAPPPPPIDPSPVKTKFPTARIKRIMQADEEVGKVAQQTPIAVGKALELFMISMVSKSAEVAKEKGQRRVTAQMLKQVAETDEQFDFLHEIVGKVEATEDKAKNSRVKDESNSDGDEEAPEPKRRGRAGGRRKKAA
ncbi:NFYB/HAP3 family transcription factor subunit [Candidatus Bathyarchaeota archaeon]|nr:NFYB/HAP3 family transcription factor subunit [Candidatus Bathyarchaeota archaeon]